MIDEFKKVKSKGITDLIIDQIKRLVINGKIKPGGKLPSEMKLIERLDVKLGDIREALRKLEFYGIVERKPQSGYFITNIESKTLGALISNIQSFESILKGEEIESLMDTRMILEARSAELAALRASEKEIKALKENHKIFTKEISKSTADDIYFHLKIVEMSKSKALRYLITIICPQIINYIYKIEKGMSKNILIEKYKQTILDHEKIISAIERGEPKMASIAIQEHLKNAYNIKNYDKYFKR